MIRVCWGLGNCAGATVGGNHSTRGKDLGRIEQGRCGDGAAIDTICSCPPCAPVWYGGALTNPWAMCAYSRLLTDA